MYRRPQSFWHNSIHYVPIFWNNEATPDWFEMVNQKELKRDTIYRGELAYYELLDIYTYMQQNVLEVFEGNE